MNTAPRNQSIELSFERLLLLIQDMQAAIARLQQPSASSGGGNQGGGGAGVYSIPAVAITAGGSVTGQTVSALVGGSLVTVNASGTVYNQMHSPTVSTLGLTIMVGANPDGSYSVITQSC